MYTHLAIITTKMIKTTKNPTYQNKGKYVLYLYVSESQRLGMVLLTFYGEGQLRCFLGLVQFFALFVLFRKTVVNTKKTVDNKAPDQVLPYSNDTFFRNKAANSGHSRAAQPNRSEDRFVEKTNQYHTCCFGTLPLGLI